MAISFKGAHFPQEIILMGVRWYVAYPLSTRHVEELMEDLRKQLADFERSIKPMGDAIPIGQLICMALRYRSDQKGYPQPALQSL
jgi:hypothetical protein